MGIFPMRFFMEENMATTRTPKAKALKKKTAAEILKERKILAFQERITHDEQIITESEEYLSALVRADVVGLSVAHKTFGAGVIIEQLPLSITVKFDFGDKRFIMPAAFVGGFLTTEDPEINHNLSQYQVLSERIRLAKEDMNVAARSIQLLEKR